MSTRDAIWYHTPHNTHHTSRISVVIDAGPMVHQGAGLARYAEQLAYHLQRDYGDAIDLTLFYNAHSGRRLPGSAAASMHRTISMGQYAWRLSVLASQIVRRPFYETRIPKSQIYHATEHLLPCLHRPTVLTVHDLIFERYPEHHTWTNRLFLKVGMPLFVKAADAIIAVSQHTKQDLVDLYGTSPEKIHVIYEGIDERFQAASEAEVRQVKQRYKIHRPYLLMVGTLEPRKNHAAALRALVQLKQMGLPHCLAIAGGEGWLFDPIQRLVGELGLDADVVFAGRVSDAELPALYSGADCLLMPSLYEGFGFPVLEAMACGTPVVCSNASSLPEVAGEAALMVEPGDEEALAVTIYHVLTEPGLADVLRRRGRAKAARFGWDTCTAQTRGIYGEVSGDYCE